MVPTGGPGAGGAGKGGAGKGGGSLSLTVLGTGTPYPMPDRPCSGYLLTAPDTRVWVDAGPGSLANLLRHTPVEQLTAIWISHLHADHTADLLSAYYALAFGDLRVSAPIPVYGPAGLAGRLAGFFGRPDGGFLAPVLDLHEITDGHQVDVGALRFTSHAVTHDLPAFGLRATYGDHTIAYSGDTGPCAGLDQLAAGADLFLCEADAASHAVAGSPQVHLTPEDAGAAAQRAGAGLLVVTHVGPSLTREEATARAAEVFDGSVRMAREGDTYPAG